MKLWQKDKEPDKQVEIFTVGRDREIDLLLAPYDVLGTLAHIQMLQSVGLITLEELTALAGELKTIFARIKSGNFLIEEGVEDIHSQVELELTRSLGDVGKKVHTGRSRNDQVLVDIKLYLRDEIEELVNEIKKLFDLLIEKSEEHKEKLLPGYTHMQIAMPSSFGLWFGAYAESLVDDVITLEAAYRVVNKNPLGSGAGFGSSFPLNRKMTTELLGFDDLNYNVAYAQMSRGKSERNVASAMANVASTLSKLAMDVCLFMNQNFGFISFPDELTTGSSIMPHKKNPDVFELIRAKCNSLQSLPNEISLIHSNLISGYHRDFQIVKEKLFPAFTSLKECLSIATVMLSSGIIRENILKDDKYALLYSVEEVNKLVMQGMPFRDAYRKVGKDIEEGNFKTDRKLDHTHEGSLENLMNDAIKLMMQSAISKFNFENVKSSLRSLLT